MSTQPVVEEIQAPVEAPKVFKARREIQPKDKDGNNLGSPHIYEAEGATQAEADQKVADKMADAISNGTLKIRELNLRVKNGGIEAPVVPEGADIRDNDEIPEPKPMALSDAELFQLANDLKDPAKMRAAYRKLYKAETGLDPLDDAKLKREQQLQITIKNATDACDAFARTHPEFYASLHNKKAICDYMVARDQVLIKQGKQFPWTVKNLEIAFRELSADGLLVERPKRVEPPPPPPRTEVAEVVEEEEEVVPEVKAAPVRQPERFPSAIRPSVASGGDTKPKPKKPSAKEIAMMSAKDYKQYAEANGLWPGR